MPEMDGLAVVEGLKGDGATRNIPVVAFTSGTSADANRLVKAGCGPEPPAKKCQALPIRPRVDS